MLSRRNAAAAAASASAAAAADVDYTLVEDPSLLPPVPASRLWEFQASGCSPRLTTA